MPTILRRRLLIAAVASLVVLLGAGVLTQRASAAGYARGLPCPARRFPG
jgi:hypothetical protein